MRLIDGLTRLIEALRGLLADLRHRRVRVEWVRPTRAESVYAHASSHVGPVTATAGAVAGVELPDAEPVRLFVKQGRRYVPAN